MNLKETWGNKVWERATTECLIQHRFSDADGGQVEELQEQVRILKRIVANIIDNIGLTDQQKLDMIEIYGWELIK